MTPLLVLVTLQVLQPRAPRMNRSDVPGPMALSIAQALRSEFSGGHIGADAGTRVEHALTHAGLADPRSGLGRYREAAPPLLIRPLTEPAALLVDVYFASSDSGIPDEEVSVLWRPLGSRGEASIVQDAHAADAALDQAEACVGSDRLTICGTVRRFNGRREIAVRGYSRAGGGWLRLGYADPRGTRATADTIAGAPRFRREAHGPDAKHIVVRFRTAAPGFGVQGDEPRLRVNESWEVGAKGLSVAARRVLDTPYATLVQLQADVKAGLRPALAAHVARGLVEQVWSLLQRRWYVAAPGEDPSDPWSVDAATELELRNYAIPTRHDLSFRRMGSRWVVVGVRTSS